MPTHAIFNDIRFHPSVAAWFEATYPEPTQVQEQAWPVIADGSHALITAPTGSGKTLTAFLWSLSQFAHGHFEQGRTQVLYISPLKALNNDIQRNLLNPLTQLTAQYDFPAISVKTRSGDTDQSERQRMLRAPPDILITTPESLSLMLTTSKGRQALGHIQSIILDEVHSIVENRRGVQLMTNLERLADIAGEFQRIALSATVSPLDKVAQYVGGTDANGRERSMQIVNPASDKHIDFRVRFPEFVKVATEQGKKIWDPLGDEFRQVIDGNQSTLFFTNSRRLAEKITLKVNEDQMAPIAYAHHGSLARDVRAEVESRLKQGELKAIVATNSLEMGIDIGALDEVVMVQSPPSVASTLQRVGRAGHAVGETSRGTLFPTHANDFLEAAVLAGAVDDRDIEPQVLMHGSLDVLAQIIISICATDPWPVEDVYQLVKRAAPYSALSREQFDLVVEMLSGRYVGSRIRELKPRLNHDRVNHTIAASRGAILALYNSGGTIPDRGYYQMRHVDTGAVLGDLDEEFVWEATIGDTFTLGTQHWQIHRITHNDVIVRAAKPGASAPPFWRSEFFNRSFHFSNRIAQFLEMADERLRQNQPDHITQALTERGFDMNSADALVEYMTAQREHTQSPLPHRHHLLIEQVKSGPAGYRGPNDPQQVVIHTYWGGRLNQPWSLAIKAAWAQNYDTKLDIHADNNAIVLQCREALDPHQLLTMVNQDNLMSLLRRSLEQSGFFGARFRECAGRSLLLTKQRFNQRLPLWMSRMQAKKLMSQVKKFEDFPVLLETWRTCLDDEFDLPNLIQLLGELQDGTVSWTYTSSTTPSPFAKDLTFGQVSRYMYADDTPEEDTLSHLSEDLIGSAVHNDALRPKLTRAVVEDFVAKRQRRYPGYEPMDEVDWDQWLKDRILLPIAELPSNPNLPDTCVTVDYNNTQWITHLEYVHVLQQTQLCPPSTQFSTQRIPEIDDPRDALTLAREILSFYGPLTEAQITRLLPSIPDGLLTQDDSYVYGELVENEAPSWCDAENLEILLRLQRAARRAQIEPRFANELPVFLANWHRVGQTNDPANLLHAIECLRTYPANIDTWLNDLIPARIMGPTRSSLDDVMTEHGMMWRGVGTQQISFGYPEDFELFPATDLPSELLTQGFTDPNARYVFNQLASDAQVGKDEFNDLWWQAVWSGQLISDTTNPLLQALRERFAITSLESVVSSRRRLARPSRGWSGNWQLLTPARSDEVDPLTALENDKERVRLVLDRYGIINRDLVMRENTQQRPWRWRDAFRALRIMELAGEVVIGHFFEGLATPQFASPRAVSRLTSNAPEIGDFWVAAQDPISPCGLGLEWPDLPTRRVGNYLSFCAGKLALVATSFGKELTYHLNWDDPALDQANVLLTHLVQERHMRMTVHTINEQDARTSPYLDRLKTSFSVVQDHKHITLEPTFL